MTSRFKTFTIPVYPLVRKFLSYHYATDPFEVTNIKNPYASYLYACLDRFDHRDTQLPRKYAKLTDKLVLGVAHWRIQSYGGVRISATKASAFNDFVKQMFFEKLTNEVTTAMAFGVGLKTATERFLVRYGITEDELSIDTALRYYARQRRRLVSNMALECCPESLPAVAVILPHERDSTDWQMESGGRQVA